MSELAIDLKKALTPDVLILRSTDFRDNDERSTYARMHPARHHLMVNVIDGSRGPEDPITIWRREP